MSGIDKANAFLTTAASEGWTGSYEVKDDETHVRVERGNEAITIWWRGNSLVETPFHHFGGTTRSLHNKATATRQLALKPDPAKVIRRSRQNVDLLELKLGEDGLPILEGTDLEAIRYPLPFDVEESTDAEILKALRGSTIVYFNSISQQALAVHVAKQLNMNLKHFNLMESSAGEPFVNFLSIEGFKSVHLKKILRVM